MPRQNRFPNLIPVSFRLCGENVFAPCRFASWRLRASHSFFRSGLASYPIACPDEVGHTPSPLRSATG